MCQCPFGLIPHFYSTVDHNGQLELIVGVNALSGLYLISTKENVYDYIAVTHRVNALSGLYLISTYINEPKYIWERRMCQCPLGLIPHFYLMHISCYNKMDGIVSMPSRAYTSFLRYPFKNLGFMRFPEPVFAGIYQNILTAAVFRAC